MTRIFLTVLVSVFFVLAGEFFMAILVKGIQSQLAQAIVRYLLVLIPQFAIFAVGFSGSELGSATSLAVVAVAVILLYYLTVPRRRIHDFVRSHYDGVVSDIPFFDIHQHPVRSTLVIVTVYWIVLAFFANELASLPQ